jgi:DNA-binding transcriptional LysR family regulator
MMQHLDHLSLHLFILVCDEGTIARASERAFLAPSAVSKRISDIEKMLKTTLFYRSPKGLELTPTAYALLHHARIVLRDLRQMERLVARAPEPVVKSAHSAQRGGARGVARVGPVEGD